MRTSVAERSGTPHRVRERRQRLGGIIILLAVLALFLLLSGSLGSRFIPFNTVIESITDFSEANNDHLLVQHLRLPRTALAVSVGAALGVAGTVMQAITRNPLADPGILGVNAGAAAGITLGIAVFSITSVVGYLWMGLAGAAVAAVMVYLLGGVRRGTNPVRLVLAGAALSVVLMSLTQIMLVNSNEEIFDRYRHWTVGSLQGRGFDVFVPSLVLIIIGVVLAFSQARALDATALGRDLSVALGASQNRVVTISALSVVMLAGAATAAAGPIAFVGLTAPHLARFLVGTNHRWVLSYVLLIGAVLVLGADMLGRIITPPGEIAVGLMIALIGGPFFVMLVRRRKLVQL